MANTVKAGWRDFQYTFSDEDNEIEVEYYVRDYSELQNVLTLLLPPNTGPPQKHPDFPTFVCRRVVVRPVNSKSVQGSQTDAVFTNWGDFLNAKIPAVRGIVVRATFKPIGAEGAVTKITDEQWDFSSQTFSLISNSPAAQSSTSIHWEWGQLVTNLKAIVRVLPKIELIQKRILCNAVPSAAQLALIGSVNAAPISLGAVSPVGVTTGTNLMQFPAETLLLLGLPVLRRWRWDGVFMCEVGLKFAVNLYQDNVAFVSGGGGSPTNGGTDYVTWNRLFFPQLGLWGRVQLGSTNAPIYRKADLNLLNSIGT